jgi:hypothetical protein
LAWRRFPFCFSILSSADRIRSWSAPARHRFPARVPGPRGRALISAAQVLLPSFPPVPTRARLVFALAAAGLRFGPTSTPDSGSFSFSRRWTRFLLSISWFLCPDLEVSARFAAGSSSPSSSLRAALDVCRRRRPGSPQSFEFCRSSFCCHPRAGIPLFDSCARRG